MSEAAKPKAMTSSSTQSCYICSDDKALPAVYLPDREEVFVGRSVETKIADTQCSRKQVRLYASYADRKVFVQQVGTRACGFNGFKTERGVKLIAQHGDCLEVLYGKHSYKVEFNPPPRSPRKHEVSRKRLLVADLEDEESQRSKRSKLFQDTESGHDMDDFTTYRTNDMPSTSTSHADANTNCPMDNGRWEDFSNKTLYVYTSSRSEPRSKIAAYDMDKTLIRTKSGLEFPKDAYDWELLYPEVPGKLKKYYDNGYKVVIFSNQASLGTGKITLKDFKLKIEKLVKKIGIPMQVYLAVGQSIYRKPRPGMWNFLVDQMNDGVEVDKEMSFYVGDAAGRPASVSRKKKDHSLADRLLAMNLNLTFYTPEEHFLGYKRASYNAPSFHPKEAIKNRILYEPSHAKLTSDKQELIIMVGCPGSGKSHFVKKHLQSYYHINRDTLGSWQKCTAKTKEALVQGESVVIDNTNPDKVARQRYIDIAKQHDVSVRCFVMSVSKEHVKHNNMFRILTDPTHQPISDMIIFSYLKNFIPPSEDEGFSEIVSINFVPQFNSEEDRELYEMYLLG